MNARMESHHVLGPRIPISPPLGRMETIANIAVPDRIVEPRSAETTTASAAATSSHSCGENPCQTGVGQSTYRIAIILGVVIPVAGALVLFVILHRRHVKRQRAEDMNDRHADLDFGLGDVPQPGRAKKPLGIVTESIVDYGEKGGKQRQLSMDLAMNSPYLLPPELQQSRESLHSLSRTIHQNEDPYNPVNQYYPGDNQSMRSQSRVGNEGSSTYTGSSKAPSRLQELNANSELLANASSMPRSSPPTASFVHPPRQNSLPQKSASNSPVEMSTDSQFSIPPYPTEPQHAHIQDTSVSRKGLPISPRPGQSLAPTPINNDRESVQSVGDAGFRASNNYLGAFINGRDASPTPPSPPPNVALPTTPRVSPTANSLPANPRPARKESLPAAQQTQTFMDNESEYGDGFQITPPSPTLNNPELMRGQRYSMDVPPEEFANAGLGAPGFDARRISMGFRPLPPNAITETDDPEIRANRIRSFYKEYFDDSKPAPAGQYYEDYDPNYTNHEAPYPAPHNNGFVMPFAEPVGRRAMTPPPRATPRFQGQEGQSRGRQGSMGAMSMSGMSQGGRNQGGGMRGPSGPPQMYPTGPYPQNPSKAYSSASGRSAASKRPMAPPAALSTLPTPSKLKEDSGLFDITDFAPPPTYRDRVAGRSESPLGERRPYSPAVPAFVPTNSAYDELAPMPSPHLLRRSGTFTALDFAPPKKFRDPDSMSDAGSIRSNRSGISQTAQFSIRNGANRVSRLPADMVFSKDDMAASLKPQWGMRQGM